MPNLIEDPDIPCGQCEWLAVFRCKPCDALVCGRHRGQHYPHDLTPGPVDGAVTKGGKKK